MNFARKEIETVLSSAVSAFPGDISIEETAPNERFKMVGLLTRCRRSRHSRRGAMTLLIHEELVKANAQRGFSSDINKENQYQHESPVMASLKTPARARIRVGINSNLRKTSKFIIHGESK